MTKEIFQTQGQQLLTCIQDVHFKILEHQPRQISCELLDKNLTVIIEDAIT